MPAMARGVSGAWVAANPGLERALFIVEPVARIGQAEQPCDMDIGIRVAHQTRVQGRGQRVVTSACRGTRRVEDVARVARRVAPRVAAVTHVCRRVYRPVLKAS